MDITKLKGHIPDSVLEQIPAVVSKFGIDTTIKLCHFLAQCHHESGGFKLTQENLNYGAKGLRGTFAKYFPTDELAAQYQRQPEKIANKVYGGRMGNGAEASGDGWKYHGRGFIQLTGKDNYKAFDSFVDEDVLAHPDLVATKYPLLSAAWFFSKNCLKRCTSNDVASITSVSKCVNGGTIGLDDRIKPFNEYYKILS
jgi:putative chitinase